LIVLSVIGFLYFFKKRSSISAIVRTCFSWQCRGYVVSKSK
jgi:hypothetical protein